MSGDVYNWDDYLIEIVQESGGALETVGVLNDAKMLNFPVSLFGRGDKVGSLSLHVLSDNASIITAEAMTFLKVFRRGEHVRDFVIGKEDWGYDAKRWYLDEYIKLQIEPLEKVLGFAICQPATAEGVFSFPAGPSDDALRWAVRYAIGANAYDDPASDSRVLSYITVEADTSAGDAIDATDITNYNLLEALQDWGQYWDTDFRLTLRKTTGREHDLYFEAFSPRRGVDRSEGNADGNKPVIFSDELGNIGTARRYRELNNLRNAVVAKDASAVSKDTDSIDIYWRRETVSGEEDAENLARELDKSKLRIGREFTYLTHPQQQIFTDFEVGDDVTTINHHLGLDAEDATLIEAYFSIGEQLEENISLVFGEFARTLPEQVQNTTAGGGGSGPSSKPKPSLRYNLRADGGTLVPFSDPYPVLDAEIDVTSDDGSVAITGDIGTNTLDLSVPGALLWSRDTGGDPYLYPTNAGDDVMVGADITLDASHGRVTANSFYAEAAGDRIYMNGVQFTMESVSGASIDAGAGIFRFKVGGGTIMEVTGTSFRSSGDNTIDCGVSFRRWKETHSMLGYFYDDLRIDASASSKGITAATNTSGWLLAGNGSRYVPTDPSTLGVWGGYWQRTGTILDVVTSGDSPRADKFILGEGATVTYIEEVNAGQTGIYGSSYVSLRVGSAVIVTDGSDFYDFAAVSGLGKSTKRWKGFYSTSGNFSDDVTVANGKGYIDTVTNTDGFVLRFNGTRGVPAALTAADIPSGVKLWTLTGDVLTTNPAGGKVSLTDTLTVTGADLEIYA